MEKYAMTDFSKPLDQSQSFVDRHIGPSESENKEMLRTLGLNSLDDLVKAIVPQHIRVKRPLQLPGGRAENDALAELKSMVSKNKIYRSYIGMGYYDCITPAVIQRNILENPGWYTQYTPYQAEISQGRLEALLNYQTLIIDLTGFEISNASLLDEGTAAAEAMAMCLSLKNADAQGRCFFVSQSCHPQTIEVVKTRAQALGVAIVVGDHETYKFDQPILGALLQYPASDGVIYNYEDVIRKIHGADGLAILAADLLSLTVLKSPAELGADIAIGTTQRFGVPMGFGGPHAAYMATKETYKRLIPGRIVGASKDSRGKTALRLALQTREQHIRRDKALSNICTAQVLLAIMASMYAIYHGPKGLRSIAERIHFLTSALALGLQKLGYDLGDQPYFDTLRITLSGGAGETSRDFIERAKTHKTNLRTIDGKTISISLDETTELSDVKDLLMIFSAGRRFDFTMEQLTAEARPVIKNDHRRLSSYLTHPVFNRYHSETEFLRYITRLQSKDLSLATAMIPLGSCTMKLNATSEMLPVTWPEISKLHPFAPAEQVEGYRQMIESLKAMLSEITGFPGISLQPNAGSQGEYAGLLVIKKYHESRNEAHRNVCLIPKSAHGTNPASATLAGLKVVVVNCDEQGNVDLNDLKTKAEEHSQNLSALMVTYPSTHGVFEEGITEICEIVHRNGGQVYMDGANMNAQVGLCRPGDFGPDVCHLNLHKTFCIPHGGGGPGMGPIGVRSHLISFLPTHPLVDTGNKGGIGPVSAAPWGSASILPISWMYIAMMGSQGLTKATQIALLNANYIASRLDSHFPVLYKGKNNFVAHECIIDLRSLKASAGIEVQDVAKRLMDYGFHAPTVSFPVPGTMMIEPTESEAKYELDRFCDAMIAIRQEIRDIEEGRASKDNNIVKNAPHTADMVISDSWDRPYGRERAAFPTAFTKEFKFWPSVGRINEVLGDRQLICACPPLDSY